VTAKVQIFGRFNGNGKADGWFLDRLSQEIWLQRRSRSSEEESPGDGGPTLRC
jgi:hypothetical protein